MKNMLVLSLFLIKILVLLRKSLTVFLKLLGVEIASYYRSYFLCLPSQ